MVTFILAKINVSTVQRWLGKVKFFSYKIFGYIICFYKCVHLGLVIRYVNAIIINIQVWLIINYQSDV